MSPNITYRTHETRFGWQCFAVKTHPDGSEHVVVLDFHKAPTELAALEHCKVQVLEAQLAEMRGEVSYLREALRVYEPRTRDHDRGNQAP